MQNIWTQNTVPTIEYNILTIYILIPILCQNFGDTKHQNGQNLSTLYLSTLDQESIKANRQISNRKIHIVLNKNQDNICIFFNAEKSYGNHAKVAISENHGKKELCTKHDHRHVTCRTHVTDSVSESQANG